MFEKGTRILAVGLALMLSSSTANAVWTARSVSSSYMSGATIACKGVAASGTATIQQEFTKIYGQTWTAFGPAPACTVSGAYWDQTLTATVADPAANAYHVKLTPSSTSIKYSNTYTVF